MTRYNINRSFQMLFLALVLSATTVNAQRGDARGNNGRGGGNNNGAPARSGGGMSTGGRPSVSFSNGGQNRPTINRDFNRGNISSDRNINRNNTVNRSNNFDRNNNGGNRNIDRAFNRNQTFSSNRGNQVPDRNSRPVQVPRNSNNFSNNYGSTRNYGNRSFRPVQVPRNHFNNGRRFVNYHNHGNYYTFSRPAINRFYYGSRFNYYPYYYRPFVGYGIGLRISLLPVGYYGFHWGNMPYYYYDGIYYRSNVVLNNNVSTTYYETIDPPLGARVPNLPGGAERVTINGAEYFEYKGTYYEKMYNEKDEVLYEVVGTNGVLETDRGAMDEFQEMLKSGEALASLPAGSKKVVLNEVSYYVTPNGDYYQEFVDGDGNVFYIKSGAATNQ
ncbi:DUF6515 family protein [Polluticaenibacter yanchengensis]|uniref:Uncharacterized protein n=1 Tax=Polluticaenibacter yanchengensis TaxID=3014562 RepID=A0ABT4UI50_9BACT|nr:hypothetical protein [Chitinophagaceae bacterium LY-5]